jgi:hypothetical protein
MASVHESESTLFVHIYPYLHPYLMHDLAMSGHSSLVGTKSLESYDFCPRWCQVLSARSGEQTCDLDVKPGANAGTPKELISGEDLAKAGKNMERRGVPGFEVHGADQLESHSSRGRNMSFLFARSEMETSHRESKMKQANHINHRGPSFRVIHIHADSCWSSVFWY